MTVQILLDDQIAAAEARLNKLKAVRDLLSDDEMTEMIRQALGTPKKTVPSPAPKAAVTVASDRSQLTALERIEKFFQFRSNAPATIKEIAEGSGATDSNVRRILYTANMDLFQQTEKMAGSRQSFFRMANYTSGK